MASDTSCSIQLPHVASSIEYDRSYALQFWFHPGRAKSNASAIHQSTPRLRSVSHRVAMCAHTAA